MGPGVGAQRRGPVPKRMSDENHHDCTGPLECRHPRLGQSLWRLGVMSVCVCVCVCGGGRTILKREARMGPGPLAVA